nr:hypothetical protein [Tanacetum cinerariifolium]
MISLHLDRCQVTLVSQKNINGGIKADVPLLIEMGEMGEPLGAEADELMVDPVVNEVFELIVEGDEQMVALVIDVDEDNSHAIQHSLALPTPGFLVPPLVIEDLSARIGNLEYGHGHLVKKVIQVSDAEVADGIAIGEISYRVSAVKGQVELSEGENSFTPAIDSCASNLIPIDYMERISCESL